jgi:hypothetical protein
MSGLQLVLGATRIERVIEDADDFLRRYRTDIGCHYIEHIPRSPQDELLPEDLAVTLLVNSQAGWRAFRSLQEYGPAVELGALPQKTLEATTDDDRRRLSRLIAQMAHWPGFGASLATKVLHKKRPGLIPILDNQAIFGAYMSPEWPNSGAQTETIKDESRILEALESIAHDLVRPENADAWPKLREIEPTRTAIQLFDSVWWMYFRSVQPVAPGSQGLR